VLWLAPFLTTNVDSTVRWQNAAIYLSVCMVQTVVAMIIAGSGTTAIAWLTGNNKHVWSTDKILTVVAGSLLAIYTVKLTYEHMYGDDDADSADESKSGTAGSEDNEELIASEMELGLPTLLANKAKDTILPEKGGFIDVSLDTERGSALAPDRAQTEEKEGLITRGVSQNALSADKKRQQTLFMIAFIGSLDDLTLFVPMLVGRGFDWLQLISGAAFAGSTIVMLCLFVGLCKPVADFLGSIPLALIVGTFSTVLLGKGLLMQ